MCVYICVFSSGMPFPYMPPVTAGSSSTTTAGLTTSTAPTAATTTTTSTDSTAPSTAPAADNPFAALMAQMMTAQQPVSLIFVML